MHELGSMRESIHGQGLWNSGAPIMQSSFRYLAERLGTVIRTTDIRILPTIYRSQSASELKFHNDSVDSRYIGWWCVTQGDPPVPTRLLDITHVVDFLSREDGDLLAKLRLKSTAVPGRSASFAAVLQVCNRQSILNVHDDLERWYPEHQELWVRLRQAIEGAARQSSICVQLQAGQCLFIDNHRFLHARGELNPRSERWLKRLWIGA